MNISGIDTNLVVALRSLLRERNVTRAGQAVGLTQSSMSHALKRLRGHFKDPLLVPAGRTLALTPLGRALVEPVDRAVAHLELVFTRPPRFDPATSDRVFRIAAPDNLELYVLPALMQAFSREAPGASLRVLHLEKDWHRALADGDIDLKLGRKYKMPAGLRSQDLFEERFVCVLAAAHAPAARRLSLAHYARLRHLVVHPTGAPADGLTTPIDALLAARGQRRQIALSVPHFVVAPFIVAATDLALTGAERLIQPFVDLLRLSKHALPMPVPTYRLTQVWSDAADSDAAHRWLRETIARVVAEV